MFDRSIDRSIDRGSTPNPRTQHACHPHMTHPDGHLHRWIEASTNVLQHDGALSDVRVPGDDELEHRPRHGDEWGLARARVWLAADLMMMMERQMGPLAAGLLLLLLSGSAGAKLGMDSPVKGSRIGVRNSSDQIVPDASWGRVHGRRSNGGLESIIRPRSRSSVGRRPFLNPNRRGLKRPARRPPPAPFVHR